MSDRTAALYRALVVFVRIVQGTLTLLAAVFTLGLFVNGGVSYFTALFLALFVLVLLAGALTAEFVLVRPIQRRFGGGVDG